MNLREEIVATIWGTTPKDSEIIADKILSKMEERIDVLKHEKIKELQFKDKSDEQFFINCMEMVKKEISK